MGKPKEVLISLSEHCDAFQDDVKYRHILPAIATSFETWGITLAASRVWEWLLETLVSHVHALQVPEPPILEGKERLTLDCDPNLVDLCQTVQSLVELLQRLATLLKSSDVATSDADETQVAVTKCRGHLVKTVVQVLSRPLAYLHLDVESQSPATSTCRIISENLVDIIRQIVPNPMTLVAFASIQRLFKLDPIKEKDYDPGSEIRWARGIGIMFFLICDKPELRAYSPSCYSPIFVFNQVTFFNY